MQQLAIRNFYDEYCKALGWAETLVEIPDYCKRYYTYKDTLKKQVEDFESGKQIVTSEGLVFRDHITANLEGFVLVDIYRKFSNRTDKDFKQKLRESSFGPKDSSDEQNSGSKTKGGFGRDIQTELIIATKFKNPNLISFINSDVVYNFVDLKFGIECKRIHSKSSVIDLFNEACKQIQNNLDINYGMVVFRLDKYIFIKEKDGNVLPKPMLVERKNNVIMADNGKVVNDDIQNQTDIFFDIFNNDLGKHAYVNNYTKVAGFCSYVYAPYLIGNPIVIRSSGFVSFSPFNYFRGSEVLNPEMQKAFNRLIQELDIPKA